MLLPVVLLSALGLAAGPWWTYQIYVQAFESEKGQIAVDNALIALGEGQANALSAIETANQKMAALERLHHPAHLCARVPHSAVACAAPDRGYETALAFFHRAAWAQAQSLWTGARIRAQKEAESLGVRSLELSTSERLPLRARRCAQCGLEFYWDVLETGRSVARLLGYENPAQAETSLRLLRRGGGANPSARWTYRLEETP